MKLHKDVEKALNDQVTLELESAYSYLGMSAYFEHSSHPGFSSWMRKQGNEELGHARKFFQYIFDRGGTLELHQINKPRQTFKSVHEVFQASLGQEQRVSEAILDIYELAGKNKDYATQSFLKWFLDEQVEEEKTVSELIGQLSVIGDSVAGLYQMDREAARRAAVERK